MSTLIKILNDPKRMFLYFLALVFLIVNSYYNLAVVRSINDALLEEKRIETANSVDMICSSLEKAPSEDPSDIEKRVSNGAESLDALPYTYAAAFRFEDGKPVLVSRRINQTGFDPFLSDIFTSEIMMLDRGDMRIGFELQNGERSDVDVYYRWTPSYVPEEERYLIVTGVSSYSIAAGIPALFTVGQWISTVVMAFLFLIFISLNACLGNAWFERENKPCHERRVISDDI